MKRIIFFILICFFIGGCSNSDERVELAKTVRKGSTLLIHSNNIDFDCNPDFIVLKSGEDMIVVNVKGYSIKYIYEFEGILKNDKN